MISFSVRSAVVVSLAVWAADASAAPCAANLPAGVILRLSPDEQLTAGVTSGPTILTVSSDVRFFPNRPPLIARGSKVFGTIIESKKAGRLRGKARLQIGLMSILTADSCEYPIAGKVIEAGRHKVEDDVIWGRGHAHRDIIALLFPPTTIYQLLRLPSRGPKLVVDNETPITIKLMETVSLAAAYGPNLSSENVRSENVRPEAPGSAAPAVVSRTSPLPELQPARVVSGPCSTKEFSTVRPLVQRNKVIRPVRNLTSYHVSVYLDRIPVLILPPCYGPSMLATPATEFKLDATASVLTEAGQKQIDLKIVPSASGNGWDILPEAGEPVVSRAN